MFLINFLAIHPAVCVEHVLSERGWNCVTQKMMSRCSVTFVSHEYIFILNTYLVDDILGEIYVPSKYSQNIFTSVP